MKPEDAEAVYHTASAALFESPEEKEKLRRRTPEEVESRKARYKHFLRHDPDGAWVAEDDGRVSGVAISGPLLCPSITKNLHMVHPEKLALLKAKRAERREAPC